MARAAFVILIGHCLSFARIRDHREMRRLLLTGAGFTKNWGGYLATEVWEHLLGHTAVRSDLQVRRILLTHPADFEVALSTIRELGDVERRKIDEALVDVFKKQDDGYKSSADEHRTPFHQDAFTSFLERFRRRDGTALIFSLNQDLFLERKYRGTPLYAPGIGEIQHATDSEPWVERNINLHAEFKITRAGINYLKIHGSADWRTEDGHVVVAGADKNEQLDARFPLLKRYLDCFSDECSENDAWLVTIGYGFRDRHINEAIARDVENNLRLVVVNTSEPKELFRIDDPKPDRLFLKKIWSAIVGYWTQPLARLFDTRSTAQSAVEYLLGREAEGSAR